MTTLPAPSRISEFARSCGDPLAASGNRPIALDDPETCWFVEEGALDVFFVELAGEEAASGPAHAVRVGPGRLVFGARAHDHRLSLMAEAVPGARMSLVAKAVPGTRIRRVPVEGLMGCGAGDETADQADAWIAELGAAVAARTEPRLPPDLLLDAGASLDAPAGAVLSARPGRVVWAAAADSAAYLGTEEVGEDGAGLVPLTSDTWLTVYNPTGLAGVSSRQLSSQGRLFGAMSGFHRLALGAERLNRVLLVADTANEEVARATSRQTDQARAKRSLFGILGPARTGDEPEVSALQAALGMIGRREGIAFRPPARRRVTAGSDPTLAEIVSASGVRGRKVRLTPEDRWWLGDSGAMLGFLSDGSPVPLLPGARGRYRVVDPATGRSVRLNRERARSIADEAWLFYRPLPDDRAATSRDLARFALRGMAPDLSRLLIAGLLSSLLTLAPPVAVGILVNSTIPSVAERTLVQVAVLLAALAVVGMLLQTLEGTSLMRLEGRAAARLSAAAWDRLLGLPGRFFKGFTAGELALRMTVFQAMRDQVSGLAASAVLALAFMAATLPLLFVYDPTLALAAFGAGAVSVAVTCVLGLLQITPERRRHAASRRLAGELLQFINGMGKIRSAGAGPSAFASWARGYREQQLATMQVSRIVEHRDAFHAAGPALVGAALFAAVVWSGVERFEVGDFLVVYAVSLTVYLSILALGACFEAMAAFVPAYEQIKPVLGARPERRVDEGPPVELGGDIRFDHVSFRYDPDGPLVIDDASIHVRRGEFVAVVGESGSGKSTLLRLALGLEEPETGGVYFDGRDLAHLNRRSVRSQIGVVPQDASLHPGNIMENITGTGEDLTIDDAWRAARLAAVDKDIAAMPMGMFTFVGDRSSTFSGGQVQRIKIAAALARNPRIVILDEATSWLDANSQAEVMKGVESMAATRIVVAHRLSTIRRAERIYVMEAGRVVQQGTFDELYEAEGPFRGLVRRQVA